MPRTYTFYASSLADRLVPVEAKEAGIDVDPTVFTVEMAFIPAATQVEPLAGDWKAADWETDATGPEPVYYARCLVGPGGTVQLAAGRYSAFVRIHSVPEVPVLRCPSQIVVL